VDRPETNGRCGCLATRALESSSKERIQHGSEENRRKQGSRTAPQGAVGSQTFRESPYRGRHAVEEAAGRDHQRGGIGNGFGGSRRQSETDVESHIGFPVAMKK